MRAVPTTGEGEVGARHAARIAEAVAGEAGCGGEGLAAGVEVTVFEAGTDRGVEFRQRPRLGRATSEHGTGVFNRRLDDRLLGDERGVLLLLGVGEGRE